MQTYKLIQKSAPHPFIKKTPRGGSKMMIKIRQQVPIIFKRNRIKKKKTKRKRKTVLLDSFISFSQYGYTKPDQPIKILVEKTLDASW